MKSERKNKVLSFITGSPEETENKGEKIASLLKPGDVVGFTGELGAGKTCMIKGICLGLKVSETVSSPTFTIINEYKGLLPVYHFDLYRITEEDLTELGYREYFEGSGVCLLEWADRAPALFPPDCIKIHFEYLEDISPENFEKRRITISGREDFLSRYEDTGN